MPPTNQNEDPSDESYRGPEDDNLENDPNLGVDDEGQQDGDLQYRADDGQVDDQQQAPPAPAPAPAAAPPAADQQQQPRTFVPQYRQGSLSDDERAEIKAKLSQSIGSWDPDQIAESLLSTVDSLADRRAAAAIDNYMAAEVHTATDQIEAIAKRNLFRAAEKNPGVLTDPKTIEMARYGAAIQYGAETGDIRGAIEKVLNSGKRAAVPPPSPPDQGGQRQQQRDRDTGQFVPVGIPTGAGTGNPGAPRRQSDRRGSGEIAKAMPWLPKDEIETVFGRG